MSITKVPAWQVKTTSSRGDAQKDLDYILSVTAMPEDFGAKGDGIQDDTLAIQEAFNTRRDVSFRGGARYLITSPIIVHEDSRRQTINGNNCSIIWRDKGNSPFNFRSSGGVVDTILRNKIIKNFTAEGPASTKSKWDDVNKCNFLSFSNSVVTHCRVFGFSNAFRSFGDGYVAYCFGDNLRNALWSCYDPGNNHIYFSELGWSAGEGLVGKGDGIFVHGVHANLAGCLPKDSEDGEDAVRGVFMSTSADGAPAKNVYVSDISCNFFGAGALNLQGDNVNVGGYIKMGSIWEDNYKPLKSTSAVYISLTNSQIGNIHLGTVHSGLGINARCNNTSVGEVTISAKKQINGTSILSAGDSADATMENVRVEGIQFYGQSTVNNDIYLNTGGISIGNVFISALNNQQGGDSIFISKGPHIERLYAKATNSASASNILMITGDPLLEKVIIRRVFGTAVTVAASANPKIHSLYVMEKQGNASPPIKILGSTGAEERVFGDVQITGVSQNKPTLSGKLRMLSYHGPSWEKASVLPAEVSYPAPTTTTL